VVVGVLFGLSASIAVGNIGGVLAAVRRQRRGDDRGFSCAPFFSVVFGAAAWIAGPGPLGIWVLAPAVLDPATWSLVALPFYLLFGGGGEPPAGEP